MKRHSGNRQCRPHLPHRRPLPTGPAHATSPWLAARTLLDGLASRVDQPDNRPGHLVWHAANTRQLEHGLGKLASRKPESAATIRKLVPLSALYNTLANAPRQFKCCGYLNPVNPPFVTDSVCTDPATAARLGGCVGPFGSFANQFLDIVFTAMFGAVALDVIVFFSSVVLLKDRAEQERYRMIDRKFGAGAL